MDDSPDRRSMYGDRAELYDRIYSFKNYAAETARLRALLVAAGVPDGALVVEAACGTGNYLAALSRHYRVLGFDRSPEMAAIAQRKVPAADVRVADMCDFTFGEPADALVCLFSSIGYVAPERLPDAAACFFRALRPGGYAAVEAWLTPDEALPGHMSIQTYDGTTATPPEPLKLARAAAHIRDGRTSVFDFHWVVVRPEGTEHFVDRHVLWVSTAEELVAAFESAGFETQWLAPGPLVGRGLLWLRRPA